jgi:integrase
LFYDFLVEEGVRDRNPVGRGYRTADGRAGRRGLVARCEPLPWIPTDAQWRAVLEVAAGESLRNRLMLALAYDAALRRGELCLLERMPFQTQPAREEWLGSRGRAGGLRHPRWRSHPGGAPTTR